MWASLFIASSASLSVASLDLCADEYALAFARHGQIASITHLGADSRENVFADRASGIPVNNGTIADVASLRPDIVLTSRTLPSGGQRIADRLGIRIVTIGYDETPDAVAARVRQMGALFGNSDASRRWVARFDALKANAGGFARSDVLWISPGGTRVGELARGWLGMAGLDPIRLSAERGRVEQIARADPDLIVESAYHSAAWHRGGDWRTHPLVRNMDVPRLTVDGRPFLCGGPGMLDVVERLQERER
ncbi:ABC transporter substrate-binding protein [Sphingomicrobium sediminis]|uniref:Fe/B12 periplasmic-binding domain-containing protein n=1 Tax=Sphingomicrobium sediminis TaxID=2950949 RepID=A0A9X2EFU9_9SPHN|nr:ABC transporter substrate-binding protein [Sphingomicrobium sediminis]MCM8556760.1 hypothetical protein [Sphingomicrobium sediminis]